MSCPICKKPLPTQLPVSQRPFCSARCKAVDLGRWINEEYVISSPLYDDADTSAPAPDGPNSEEEAPPDDNIPVSH